MSSNENRAKDAREYRVQAQIKIGELKDRVREFPDQSGVYLMKNSSDRVIYVGKAKNLRQRVRSYLGESKDLTPKTRLLVAHIHVIDYILTKTEVEAFLLEASLIKKFRPKYNIRLKDDKTYPYIRVSMKDDFPRLYLSRSVKPDGSLYFGPYTRGGSVFETMRFLNQSFQLRDCTDHVLKSRERPCMNHQLQRCTAPCVNLISPKDYDKDLQKALQFLKGQSQSLVEELRARMFLLSEEEKYEQAARWRDTLKSLAAILEKQSVVDAGTQKDLDVVAFCGNERGTVVQFLHVRQGRVLGTRSQFIAGLNSEDPQEDPREWFVSVINQYYWENIIPDEVIVSFDIGVELLRLLKNVLSERKYGNSQSANPTTNTNSTNANSTKANSTNANATTASSTSKNSANVTTAMTSTHSTNVMKSAPSEYPTKTVEIASGADNTSSVDPTSRVTPASSMAPTNGVAPMNSGVDPKTKEVIIKFGSIEEKESELIEMTLRNAKAALLKQSEKVESKKQGLEEIKEKFNLPQIPFRIECYDISNFQGKQIVASQVVFERGMPAKDQYRLYKIKTLDDANDFASMNEVIGRRFKHQEWDDPQLIVIDGGKGQLNAALAALRALGKDSIPIVSLAKAKTESEFDSQEVTGTEERFFLPARQNPIYFRRNAEGLRILTHLRDEAHRFAITFHRKLREERSLSSVLDEIDGIGEKRKRILLEHFESLEAIEAAPIEAIASLPSFHTDLAELVKGYLRTLK